MENLRTFSYWWFSLNVDRISFRMAKGLLPKSTAYPLGIAGERLVAFEENGYLDSGDTEAYKYLFLIGRGVSKSANV